MLAALFAYLLLLLIFKFIYIQFDFNLMYCPVSFHPWVDLCNYHQLVMENSITPNKSFTLPLYGQTLSPFHPQETTDPFSVSLVLPFPGRHVSGFRE